MSANLDLVRSIYAAWERGDFGSAEWADPEMLYEYADGPSPGTWNGLDGMAEGFRDFLGAWKDWGVVADDYLELAGERVLVSFHLTGRGKASGLDIARVRTNGATLFAIVDGRITRVVQYLDRDRALADLGLKDQAMSQGYVDLVRSIFAAWERDDFSSTDWADPEIDFVLADGPEPGTWTGLAGMAEVNRVWLSAWEGFRVDVDEYRALDDERILVLVRVYGRGKTSGVELGQLSTNGANLLHVGNGKVTRWVRYFDRDRAFADLGLAPPCVRLAGSKPTVGGSPSATSTPCAPDPCSHPVSAKLRSASSKS